MRGAGEHPPCSWRDEPASNIRHQGRPAFGHPLRREQQHLRDASTERTLRKPMDCSPPGSSVSGQESRSGLPCFPPGNGTQVSGLLHWQAGSLSQAPPGKLETAYDKARRGNQHLLEVQGTERRLHGDVEAGEPPGTGRPLRRGLWGSLLPVPQNENIGRSSRRSGAGVQRGAGTASAGDTLEADGGVTLSSPALASKGPSSQGCGVPSGRVWM